MNQSYSHQALIEQLLAAFNAIPFNQTLGLQLEKLSFDHVHMRFDMKEQLIGNFLQGILHGGVISSVLDMAGGMIVMANAIHRFQDKSVEEMTAIISNTSTIDLHINYIRPGKGCFFTAEAKMIKAGSHISFTHMQLINDKQVLIATANGTYLIKQ